MEGCLSKTRTVDREAVHGAGPVGALCVGLGLVVVAVLSGCADERPQSTVSPQLDSGIISSNGGGTRTLGNAPSLGVTTRVR